MSDFYKEVNFNTTVFFTCWHLKNGAFYCPESLLLSRFLLRWPEGLESIAPCTSLTWTPSSLDLAASLVPPPECVRLLVLYDLSHATSARVKFHSRVWGCGMHPGAISRWNRRKEWRPGQQARHVTEVWAAINLSGCHQTLSWLRKPRT